MYVYDVYIYIQNNKFFDDEISNFQLNKETNKKREGRSEARAVDTEFFFDHTKPTTKLIVRNEM